MKSKSSGIVIHAMWIEMNHTLNSFFFLFIVCCGNIIQVDQTSELVGQAYIQLTENRCIVMIDVIEIERWTAT